MSGILSVSHRNDETLQEDLSSGRAIKSLYIDRSPDLTIIPSLRDRLLFLSISECRSLVTISDFPGSLTGIVIFNCPSLINIPDFPGALRNITIVDCPSLVAIPEFPDTLTELAIERCPQASIGHLPINLTMLKCDINNLYIWSENRKFSNSIMKLLNKPGFRIKDLSINLNERQQPEFIATFMKRTEERNKHFDTQAALEVPRLSSANRGAPITDVFAKNGPVVLGYLNDHSPKINNQLNSDAMEQSYSRNPARSHQIKSGSGGKSKKRRRGKKSRKSKRRKRKYTKKRRITRK
jgi:hypothetical protein